MKQKNFTLAFDTYKYLIKYEYSRHKDFIFSKNVLDEEEKARYLSFIQVDATETMYNQAIGFLSNCLKKAYQQNVIILIDEYDVPLDKAFQNGYYKEMVSLIRGLFGQALKTNEFLQFAVLTGCLRISKESIFTGLTALLFAGSGAGWLVRNCKYKSIRLIISENIYCFHSQSMLRYLMVTIYCDSYYII